tara:strand:- start:1322 stop:2392 length:1071 start_codon:yes stop_codon:yes gene_type:complete
MNTKLTYAIGLMSGTSLDGLDIVYVTFDENDLSRFEILSSETINYSSYWKQRLQNAIDFDEDVISNLNQEYGVFLGEQTKKFITRNKITSIDFIASHGHTIFHQPANGITLQIGDGQEISTITNCKVVCDFRSQDVKLGGQGAPLVPIGDQLLFSEYAACINLGGFANISFEKENQRIAFDICPVNIVLNHYSRKLGLEFDDKGMLASKGEINNELLSVLNQLEFYRMIPPKSLGLEWVQQFVFPLLENYQLKPSTIIRTFTEHVAHQISIVIEPFENVLFTGGGVYNDFLINRIQEIVNTKIVLPSDEIINYKEALIFALLGLLKLQGKVNCLSSVTGAKKNHSSGVIFNPNNSY